MKIKAMNHGLRGDDTVNRGPPRKTIHSRNEIVTSPQQTRQNPPWVVTFHQGCAD